MLIKNLVLDIKQKLNDLVFASSFRDTLILVESMLAKDEIILFLHKHSYDERVCNPQSLKPFYELLSQRWCGIKNTDASYVHSPYSLGNQAYLTIAQIIAPYLQEQPYFLLMPTVGAIIQQLSRPLLSDFEFHEFILADDGSPLEVITCLENAYQNRTSDLYTTGIIKRLLNDREKERIIKHSDETKIYYTAIKYVSKHHIEEDDDLYAARKALYNKMLERQYVVSASYHKEGRQKLAKYILSKLGNQESFIKIMKTISSDDWHEFVKEMDVNDLEKLFLQNNSFVKVLQNPASYLAQDEKHNRIFLFVMLEIFLKKSLFDQQENVLGFLYQFGKKQLTKYNEHCVDEKKIKQFAAAFLQKFLASNKPLSELTDYLELNDKYNAVLFEYASMLALIVKQIMAVGDPHFFQQKPSGLMRIFQF